MRHGPANYTQDELREMVRKMREVCQVFYAGAVRTNCHPFIEFCGLMSKYIDVCERAVELGQDFTGTSIHSGGTLPVFGHDIDYLAEKFGCIFAGTLFANPEMWERFKAGIGREIGA